MITLKITIFEVERKKIREWYLIFITVWVPPVASITKENKELQWVQTVSILRCASSRLGLLSGGPSLFLFDRLLITREGSGT
jgi:hypothetical protein